MPPRSPTAIWDRRATLIWRSRAPIFLSRDSRTVRFASASSAAAWPHRSILAPKVRCGSFSSSARRQALPLLRRGYTQVVLECAGPVYRTIPAEIAAANAATIMKHTPARTIIRSASSRVNLNHGRC